MAFAYTRKEDCAHFALEYCYCIAICKLKSLPNVSVHSYSVKMGYALYFYLQKKNENVTLTILDFLRFFEDTFQRHLFITREEVIFTNTVLIDIDSCKKNGGFYCNNLHITCHVVSVSPCVFCLQKCGGVLPSAQSLR